MKTLTILLLILPVFAFAHEDDHKIIQNVTNVTKVTNVYNSIYQDSGVASAVALSQLHYSLAVHRLQISIGAGHYNDENAIAAGFGLRINEHFPLVSGSISRDSQHTAYGLGATFTLP